MMCITKGNLNYRPKITFYVIQYQIQLDCDKLKHIL